MHELPIEEYQFDMSSSVLNIMSGPDEMILGSTLS